MLITDGSILTITCPDAKCKKQGRIEAPEVCKWSQYSLLQVMTNPQSLGHSDHVFAVIEFNTKVLNLLFIEERKYDLVIMLYNCRGLMKKFIYSRLNI